MSGDLFPTDAEVTVTVTGRVVSHTPGGLVVEYLTATGWVDRIIVRPEAPGVTSVAAPAPSQQEIDRRLGAYIRTFVGADDSDERDRILASAPYGGIPTGEVA